MVFEIVSGIILILISLIIVFLVMMQESKSSNSDAVTGNSSDSYYSKNQTKTRDFILAKITKVFAILFFVSLICVNAFTIFIK